MARVSSLIANLTQRTSRAGEAITLEYDASDRLVRKLVPASTSGAPGRDELYGYDLSGLQVCAAVHAAGATSPSDTCAAKAGYTHRTTTAYDFAGRVTSETSDDGTNSRTVAYQYDADSNRTRITWPDGYYVTYEHDDLGRIIYVRENGSAVIARNTWNDYDGRLQNIYRGGSAWGTAVNPGSAELYVYHVWENDGDLDLQILKYRETGQTTNLFDYAYDGSAKLISETRPATWRWSAVAEETIAYDPANALDQYTVAGGLALTHDTNGNRASYDGLATLHDAENRLVAATTSAMSVIYVYDAAGRRVMKDFVSGAYADTAFLHAGDMEIAEYDASGTLLRRFIPGLGTDDRVAMIEVGSGCGDSASSCSETSRAYYVADRIGHVIATFDASGDLIDSYRYTPFGVHDDGTPQAGQPFRYTGRRLDPETGLYFYRARYYDQQHGRFLETDPVGYEDQMNLYAYVGNDPLNATDPTGEEFEIRGDEKFIVAIKTDVETIRSGGPAGEALIRTIEHSAHLVQVFETEDVGSGATNTDAVDANYGSDGRGTGSDIYYNPTDNNGGTDTNGSTERPAFVGLAHEFGHARELAAGIADLDTDDPGSGTPPSEQGALDTENDIRREHNIPERPKYFD